MSNENLGKINWLDLTVPDAGRVRDFYAEVVGWSSSEHPMTGSEGDYADYNMIAPGGDTVTGICHARGANAKIPPAWLVYINVPDAAAAAARAAELGGTILDGPRAMGGGVFAVAKDPAGAVFALWQEAPAE